SLPVTAMAATDEAIAVESLAAADEAAAAESFAAEQGADEAKASVETALADGFAEIVGEDRPEAFTESTNVEEQTGDETKTELLTETNDNAAEETFAGEETGDGETTEETFAGEETMSEETPAEAFAGEETVREETPAEAFAGEEKADEEALAETAGEDAAEEVSDGQEAFAGDPEAWAVGETKILVLDSSFKEWRFSFTPEENGKYFLNNTKYGYDGYIEDIAVYDSLEFTDEANYEYDSWEENLVTIYNAKSGQTYGIKVKLSNEYYESADDNENWEFTLTKYESPIITVDGNGGSTADGQTSYTVETNGEYHELEDILNEKGSFERAGYRLLGWAETADSENPRSAYYFGDSETVTYYAIWEQLPTISLNETKQFESGYFFIAFTPEEDGWYTFKDEFGDSWNSYIDIYNGCDFKTSLGQINNSHNELALQLTGGRTCGIKVTVEEGYTTDLTVIKTTDFVILDGNGGASENGTAVQKVPVYANEWMYTLLYRAESFARDGYKQIGWSTSPDGEGVQNEYNICPEAGETYYAVWGKLVSVTFHGNGVLTQDGQESIASDDVVEGYRFGEYYYMWWSFERPVGKYLSGWALTPDAEEADEESVIQDGMVLYAVWAPIHYEVKLYAKDGYFATPAENTFFAYGYYGEKLDILPSDIPTSNTKGKVFDKWYTDYDCTKPLEVSLSEYRPTEAVTLYAGYKDDGTMVSKITLNKKTASVLIGKTVTLKATVAPKTALNKAVTWTSSNKSVATVSAKGVVKGLKKGTVTITAKAKDGSGVKATCKVTVKQPVTKITLSKTQATVKAGKTLTLKATVKPDSAHNKAVSWTSSNKKVATVTQKGVVKGIAKGTTVITVKAKDGSGKYVKCKITVK
ncbi:MAG: Ig-like domain-containing protein, partial [Lachnospiraceae bacterium]